jgi:hypothetical protein
MLLCSLDWGAKYGNEGSPGLQLISTNLSASPVAIVLVLVVVLSWLSK